MRLRCIHGRFVLVLFFLCCLPLSCSCRPRGANYHTTGSHTTGSHTTGSHTTGSHTTGFATSHATRFSSNHTTLAPFERRPLFAGQPGGFRPATREVKLIVTNVENYEKVLRDHQGKVILVDFWATWCAPCKATFPRVLGYGRDFADNGLVVVSVSLDDPPMRQEALDYLRSVDARIDNLISQWGGGTASVDSFEIGSALPYYKLYDRRGQLRYEFSGSPEGLEGVEPLDQVEQRFKELIVENLP